MSADPDPTPADPLGCARELLTAAVALGSPTLAAGDPRGAYEIYACAARLVLMEGPAVVMGALTAALERTDFEPDPRARAATLHTLFRELIGANAELDDLILADDCEDPPDPQQIAQGHLMRATTVGDPAVAAGYHRGAAEVFAAAARLVIATVVGAVAECTRLRRALDEAYAMRDEARQAEVLRLGIAEVLELPPPVAGPTISRREMYLILSMAMQIGTPAYNQGDHRGCYETYACAARLLARVGGPEADSLREALRMAALEIDTGEQAWILRRAFDRLMATRTIDP